MTITNEELDEKLNEELDEKLEEYEKGWTYSDVLAFGLAASGLKEFDTDPAKWNRAVAAVQRRYPNVLDEIYIDNRIPDFPWSLQVDRFINLMVRSGKLQVGANFRKYHMEPVVSESLHRQQSNRFRNTAVQEIAESLAESFRAQLYCPPTATAHVKTNGHK